MWYLMTTVLFRYRMTVLDDGIGRRGIHHFLSLSLSLSPGCEWDSGQRNPIFAAEEAPDGKLASLRRAGDYLVSAPLDTSTGVCTGAGVLIFPVVKRVQSEVPAPL